MDRGTGMKQRTVGAIGVAKNQKCEVAEVAEMVKRYMKLPVNAGEGCCSC